MKRAFTLIELLCAITAISVAIMVFQQVEKNSSSIIAAFTVIPTYVIVFIAIFFSVISSAGLILRNSEKTKEEEKRITPYPQEIEKAKRMPNGYVYRIEGKFSDDEAIPPEAILGAWSVNEDGIIVGDFQPNQNYKPTGANHTE